MLAAYGLGVIGLVRALGATIVVAIVVIPLGFLSTLYVPAEGAHGGGEAHAGDATRGAQLFRTGACPSCHTIQGISTGTIGPELTHIGTVAESRKPGMSADAYIHESIANPSAFIVSGFSNQMPPGLATGQNLDDLVAFLVTQK
jgi:mono/diheme cytochrome c family protein